jgi:hypothetical protein
MINWLMLFKQINRCLQRKSYETHKYKMQCNLLIVKAGGKYKYPNVLMG